MTAGSNAAPAASALFFDLEAEFAATRRLLEQYPDAHADWRPHERSTSLATLAAHIASLPRFGHVMATTSELDFATTPYVAPAARTRAEMLALFDESAQTMRNALATMDAAAFAGTWRLLHGDAVLLSGSRGELIRRFFVSHTAHHRGQLTVYYRLLGVPVPGMYGPSADEM